MSIRVEVVDGQVEDVTGEKNGKSYHIRKQTAFAYIPTDMGKLPKYPTQISVALDRDAPPYTPGFYQVDPRSFMVGDFMSLKLGRIKLSPLPSVPK